MSEDQYYKMMREIELRRDSLARLCMVAESAARVFMLCVFAGCAMFVTAIAIAVVLS